MIPDAATRFASVSRALRDVVIPALAPAEALALEQATLAADQIDMIAEQWDGAVENAVATRARWRGLAVALIGTARGGEQTELARRALKQALEHDGDSLRTSAVEAEGSLLARLVAELVQAMSVDGEAAATRAVAISVTRHALDQSTADRRWFSRTGMDPDAAELRAARPLL